MDFDYKLWFDCDFLIAGGKNHKLRNKMSIYRGQFWLFQQDSSHWRAFKESEKELRKLVFEIQTGKFKDEYDEVLV